MKKWLTLLLAIVMVLALTACGGGGTTTTEPPVEPPADEGTTETEAPANPEQPTANTFEVALITDVGNIDDGSFNEGAWNGMKAYCEASGVTYAYYQPSGDTNADRLAKIKDAIDKGAKVVVCPGYLFEDTIYEAQTLYPDVQFLLLDGTPHDADYNYFTAPNTHCILYQEEQAGFFAGYAAVMDGYTKLGFLGGMDVPAVIRYGFGFVQGAEAAAEELGLAAGTIEIKYWYSGTFGPEDDIFIKMNSWYSEGTEVVFACGGGIYISCLSAAEANDALMIGVDVDQGPLNERIITSAMKELAPSVELSLAALFENDGAWDASRAGQTAVLGAAVDCVRLPTDTASWRLKTWTVAEYEALFEKVKSGEIVVSNDDTTRPTVSLVSVDYQS